jgi:hypothetical protein
MKKLENNYETSAVLYLSEVATPLNHFPAAPLKIGGMFPAFILVLGAL